MKLVISEKNSVAQSLSRVIGATKRQNGYLEGKTYNADLLLSTEADGRPQFSMEFEDRKGGGK